jgi:hypothetical protein
MSQLSCHPLPGPPYIEAFPAQTRLAPAPEPLEGQALTCQPLQCHQPVPLQPGVMTSSTVTRWNGSYPVKQAPRSRLTPFAPPQARDLSQVPYAGCARG